MKVTISRWTPPSTIRLKAEKLSVTRAKLVQLAVVMEALEASRSSVCDRQSESAERLQLGPR